MSHRKNVFTYCLRVFEVRVGMATVVVLSLSDGLSSKTESGW